MKKAFILSGVLGLLVGTSLYAQDVETVTYTFTIHRGQNYDQAAWDKLVEEAEAFHAQVEDKNFCAAYKTHRRSFLRAQAGGFDRDVTVAFN